MTLTNRLSLFFLTALAVVLAGFSITLYVLASVHLHRQVEERLEGAMNTLTAAAEVKADCVEWEPEERKLAFGAGPSGDEVIWFVHDGRGRVVDRTAECAADDFLADTAPSQGAAVGTVTRFDSLGGRWRFRQRWLQAINVESGLSSPDRTPQTLDAGKHQALCLTAGVLLEPVRTTLNTMAFVLAGLSLGAWMLALFAGRAICRRALRPVRSMARAARDMDAADLGQRLPAVNNGDELTDLSLAFNNLLDRLEEAFERQRRFTGDASHQLRTPLAAILGQAEVALRRDRSAAEYQHILSKIRTQAGHLERIVEALLFLARADADAQLPGREGIDLTQWLPEYLRGWSEHGRAGDIHFEHAADSSCIVEVQPAMLGELLNVLIDNACKYSLPGTPITVRLRRDDSEVCVEVEDRGYGIAAGDVPHLFTPFFRSPDSRRRGIEGLGLGLSIARRLAGAFGGTVRVTSDVGRGSCFTLSLPRPIHSGE
jgi:heavy metal sensor kinase